MHNLEPYSQEQHGAILYAAALEGVDTTPIVGGADRFIGYGSTKYGPAPACILDVVSTDYVAEPHVTWFPWVRASDKIVNFKWAVEYLSKDKQVFLTVQKDQKEFFEHFVKKGLLRKVGFIKDLPIVEEIHMYQYIKKRGNNVKGN